MFKNLELKQIIRDLNVTNFVSNFDFETFRVITPDTENMCSNETIISIIEEKTLLDNCEAFFVRLNEYINLLKDHENDEAFFKSSKVQNIEMILKCYSNYFIKLKGVQFETLKTAIKTNNNDELLKQYRDVYILISESVTMLYQKATSPKVYPDDDAENILNDLVLNRIKLNLLNAKGNADNNDLYDFLCSCFKTF